MHNYYLTCGICLLALLGKLPFLCLIQRLGVRIPAETRLVFFSVFSFWNHKIYKLNNKTIQNITWFGKLFYIILLVHKTVSSHLIGLSLLPDTLPVVLLPRSVQLILHPLPRLAMGQIVSLFPRKTHKCWSRSFMPLYQGHGHISCQSKWVLCHPQQQKYVLWSVKNVKFPEFWPLFRTLTGIRNSVYLENSKR